MRHSIASIVKIDTVRPTPNRDWGWGTDWKVVGRIITNSAIMLLCMGLGVFVPLFLKTQIRLLR